MRAREFLYEDQQTLNPNKLTKDMARFNNLVNNIAGLKPLYQQDGTPVIINLSEMDPSDQKRILDFASGLAFALRGTIERVTNSVFLISPANVDLGAEARQQVAQDGFFNQV